MLYALIITTFMSATGSNPYPVAVAQTTTPGFTTEQSCRNAGVVAVNGAPAKAGTFHQVTTIFQCAALSL